MSERQSRLASAEVQELVRQAHREVLLHFAGKIVPEYVQQIGERIEEIIGPFHKDQVDGFGVRYTKLQAESDGFHEYVTIYF